MITWLTLAGMALITFGNRYLFFGDSIRYQMGPRVRRLLSYSVYAILTAIWAPIVVNYSPAAGFAVTGYDYAVAGLAAAVLAFLRVPTLLVVLVSTALFFALRFWS